MVIVFKIMIAFGVVVKGEGGGVTESNRRGTDGVTESNRK